MSPPFLHNTPIADIAKDSTSYPQWFVDLELELKIDKIITTAPVGLISPVREACETLSVAIVNCMLAVASLPHIQYQVPDFILQKVTLSVADARKAYLDAELWFLDSTLPNMAYEILNNVQNQLESLRNNWMNHYFYRDEFAIHDPIHRLRKYCVRVMLDAQKTDRGPRQTPNNSAIETLATPPAVDAGKPIAERDAPAMAAEGKEAKSNTPFILLENWADIIRTLNEAHDKAGWKNNQSMINQLSRFNVDYDGPIKLPKGKGSRPSVSKFALLSWWQTVGAQHDARTEENEANAKSERFTVSESHNYGATGTVIPGISGSVKPSRATGEKGKEEKR